MLSQPKNDRKRPVEKKIVRTVKQAIAEHSMFQTGDRVLVAVSGGAGTLSEIGHSRKVGKPVVGLKTIPDLRGVHYVDNAREAISRIFELI